jgi:transposase
LFCSLCGCIGFQTLSLSSPCTQVESQCPASAPVTAAAFLAAVDDAQRFRHAHQLEAYLGLVPREYSSGETQRRGPITKAGHSHTRWLLIQAALSILRRRPPAAEALWTWALRIAARGGTHVAIVALARRLAGILYALLRDGTVYAPRPARHHSDPVAALHA